MKKASSPIDNLIDEKTKGQTIQIWLSPDQMREIELWQPLLKCKNPSQTIQKILDLFKDFRPLIARFYMTRISKENPELADALSKLLTG